MPLPPARHYRSSVAADGKRIAVLFHERERGLDPARYLVHHFAEFWRADGHDVVDVYGTERLVPADIALVHVDLTVVPGSYLEFAARYPVVLNGRVRDIRKTTTSRYLLRPGDDWECPVIVKTDLNHAGSPERVYASRWLRRSDRARALADRLTRRGAINGSRDYRVFDRASDVPAALRAQCVARGARTRLRQDRLHHPQRRGDPARREQDDRLVDLSRAGTAPRGAATPGAGAVRVFLGPGAALAAAA
jgi:hypothetical protein